MNSAVRQPVFRFAPSPNGHLHLGHACSALLNAGLARRLGGRFLLRVENIDTRRCTPGLEADMLEDLQWLGLDWEKPVLRQSDRFEAYTAAADTLKRQGLLYPCFCSRGLIAREAGGDARRDPDGALVYPGTCAGLAAEHSQARIRAGAPHAWRLRSNAFAPAQGWSEARDESLREFAGACGDLAEWGDAVIARRDTPASYHLAVVVDDAFQGVTHAVRGRDLFASTAIHRALQQALGLPAPVYFHHRLLLDGTMRKLSKSLGSRSLRDLREAGVPAAAVRAAAEGSAASG